LAEAGIEASVGSVGDSYNNALAETIIGLYEEELFCKEGSWRGVEQVEPKTLHWLDWFNNRRLFRPLGNIPPVEYEALYFQREEAPAIVAELKQPGLRKNRGSSILLALSYVDRK
jgi:transposase InsO family protein